MTILISQQRQQHDSSLLSSIIVFFLLSVIYSTELVVVSAAAGEEGRPTLNKEGMNEQWNLWPYFTETIKWHSEWIRYNATSTPTSTINEQFRAWREFKHNEYESSSIQHNTYFYNDDRGTVSDCRACGPWILNKTDPISSSPYGVIHPSRPYMGTILFPHRSAAWLMKDIPKSSGISPVGFELFLGDGQHLRLSVGVVYDILGDLTQVSAIREDSRDFGLFWSTTTVNDTKKYTDRNEQEYALKDIFGSSKDDASDFTIHTVTLPGPNLKATKGDKDIDKLNSLKLVNPKDGLLENDVVFEMPDGIYLVCPSKLPTVDGNDAGSSDFAIAAGWKKNDGSWTSSVEARYVDFVMNEVVYVTQISTPPDDDDPSSAASSKRTTRKTMNVHHEIIAAVVSVVAIIGLLV